MCDSICENVLFVNLNVCSIHINCMFKNLFFKEIFINFVQIILHNFIDFSLRGDLYIYYKIRFRVKFIN